MYSYTCFVNNALAKELRGASVMMCISLEEAWWASKVAGEMSLDEMTCSSVYIYISCMT